MRIATLLAVFALLFAGTTSQADERLVVGGQTNVLLDTATLSTVGLDLSSVSSDVIVPGNLGADSVAFGVNSRNGNLPTTFVYEVFDLAPFSGTIEHSGSVFFNMDSVEVGDFTIGFDGSRVGGANSGFFVESTTGINAILFDIENPTNLSAGSSLLSIEADLLVSPEFAAFLNDSSLTGVDVGDALVQATAIPEPATAGLLGLVGFVAVARRKRS